MELNETTKQNAIHPHSRLHTSCVEEKQKNNTGFSVRKTRARQIQPPSVVYECNASECTNAVMAMR